MTTLFCTVLAVTVAQAPPIKVQEFDDFVHIDTDALKKLKGDASNILPEKTMGLRRFP